MTTDPDRPKPPTSTVTPPTVKPSDKPDRAKTRAEGDDDDDEDRPKVPTLREMEEELGDKPGSIRLDIDLATGEARQVKVDGKGKESR